MHPTWRKGPLFYTPHISFPAYALLPLLLSLFVFLFSITCIILPAFPNNSARGLTGVLGRTVSTPCGSGRVHTKNLIGKNKLGEKADRAAAES